MALPRAVADTNVLVAAAITPRGVCGRLLDAAIDGRWQLVASLLLLVELDEVLARDKFRRWLSAQESAQFVTDVSVLADAVADPALSSGRETADPKDEFLVALARVAGVEALVSGDPHLTELVDLLCTPSPSSPSSLPHAATPEGQMTLAGSEESVTGSRSQTTHVARTGSRPALAPLRSAGGWLAAVRR